MSARVRARARRSRALSALAVVAALALGCGFGDGGSDAEEATVPVLEHDTLRIRVASAADTVPLTVEVAETDVQRSYGLMQRDDLAEDRGMLFAYETGHAPTDGFWMWRTRIPLDVAFLDADGTIVGIRTMTPCDQPRPNACPSYAPGVPWEDALEVRGGWFARHGFGVGDRVLVPAGPVGGAPDAGPGAAAPAAPGDASDDPAE